MRPAPARDRSAKVPAMRRIPTCVAGAALSAFLVAGCGSSSSSSSNTTTSGPPSTTTAPASTGETATTAGSGGAGSGGATTTLPGQRAGSGTVASVVFTGTTADPTVTVSG